MYANKLIDAYKEAQKYIQDKQVAHDLGMSTQKLSNVRKGIRYLSENEALFIAESLELNKEMVLVYLAADKAKTYEAQQAWANIAKKYNGLRFTTISSICGAILVTSDSLIGSVSKFALCELMLKARRNMNIINSLESGFYQRLDVEIQSND